MSKKILVVEDTQKIREIVCHLLKTRGYEVAEAGDGEEAEQKVSTFGPDLIVLDAMIPKKTGFEVCAHLKADEKTRSIVSLGTGSGLNRKTVRRDVIALRTSIEPPE